MTPDTASLSIVQFPHECLTRRARPVDPSDPAVAAVAERMLTLMREANGVGLAAPQVGLPWRLFVTNAGEADPVDRIFVNPVLHLGRGSLESGEEGCLSLPGIHVQVRRATFVRVEAFAPRMDGSDPSGSAPGGSYDSSGTLGGGGPGGAGGAGGAGGSGHITGAFELEAEGFLARVIQHEFDHLEGTLIIDRMGPMDRLTLRRTIEELKAAAR